MTKASKPQLLNLSPLFFWCVKSIGLYDDTEAKIVTLNVLFERMVPGAVLILDDYGWLGYRAQKLAEDPWFAARGYYVVELPTGQGMVIKQQEK